MSKVIYGKRWTTEHYTLNDSVDVTLSDCSKNDMGESFAFGFTDSETTDEFFTVVNKDKLRSLAVFLLNYLEKN